MNLGYMVIRTSRSPEETVAFGEELGRTAPAGTLYGLIGDLGAGKTQFVRGFARGLGVTERVHSPTFNLVNEYASGRLPCYHLDLYRLESVELIRSAGLEPYFHPQGAVALVEWFDRIRGRLPVTDALRVVTLSIISETERTVGYEDPRT